MLLPGVWTNLNGYIWIGIDIQSCILIASMPQINEYNVLIELPMYYFGCIA